MQRERNLREEAEERREEGIFAFASFSSRKAQPYESVCAKKVWGAHCYVGHYSVHVGYFDITKCGYKHQWSRLR